MKRSPLTKGNETFKQEHFYGKSSSTVDMLDGKDLPTEFLYLSITFTTVIKPL
jgi:hypothetical protein